LPRTEIIFPVELPHGLIGEALNVNRLGLCLHFRERIPSRIDTVLLNSIIHGIIKIRVVKTWEKRAKGSFYVGCKFLNLNKMNKNKIKDALSRLELLDGKFVSVVRELRVFLHRTKVKFDKFDEEKPSELAQIKFIKSNRSHFFYTLDKKFDRIWRIVEKLDKNLYILYKIYIYHMLEYFLERGIEINTHISRKPLGYPGDFITMNYILDYHKDKYLGDSSYQKLVNHYTCNIPISCSNIARKNFLKKKILDTIKREKVARITSVGSGSVRELIELVREGQINRPVIFKWLDFEKKALIYVKDRLKEIDRAKRKYLKIKYICRNILSFADNNFLSKAVGKQNLIYSSGFFDYLPEEIARRLVYVLCNLLDKGGELVICNASLENSSHRAYYEMLGDWIFYHRRKEELLNWAEDLRKACKIKIDNLPYGKNYLYMSILRS